MHLLWVPSKEEYVAMEWHDWLIWICDHKKTRDHSKISRDIADDIDVAFSELESFLESHGIKVELDPIE